MEELLNQLAHIYCTLSAEELRQPGEEALLNALSPKDAKKVAALLPQNAKRCRSIAENYFKDGFFLALVLSHLLLQDS